MAKKILNRKELRAQNEKAEAAEGADAKASQKGPCQAQKPRESRPKRCASKLFGQFTINR